jgi:outer membrane protein assembly factor BamB
MIVAGNVLIAASNWRALYAHDLKTGKLLWKKSDNGYSSRSSTATWENDTLYVASQKGIGMINAKTGEVYNYFETPYNLQVATKPIITGNRIIIGTSHDGIAAFNKKSGKEIWHTKTGKAMFYSAPYSKPESETVESAPVLFNGMILFGASDGFIYTLNPETGEVIQKVNLGAPIFAPATPLLKSFFVVDFGGNVYRFLQTNLK